MTAPWGPPAADDASFAGAMRLASRHRRVILGVPLLLAALALGFGLVRPRVWSSRASLLPQKVDPARSGIGALASQLGLNLSANDAGQTPAFYTELLRTPQVLGSVAETSFRITRPHADSGTLTHLLRIKASDSMVAREKTIQALRAMTSVRADEQIGLVRLSVTTGSPELSQQVALRMIALVNEFNVARRQTGAAAERQFTEMQRAHALEELQAAEARLMRFLEGNRNYAGSPTLQAMRDRLQREVSFKAQVYSSVSQAHEQARIDEVRDTPLITVIQAPELPVRPDSRRLIVWLAVALLVGLVLGVGVALLREFRVWGMIRNALRPGQPG